MSLRIGELLVKRQQLTLEQLRKAVEYQREHSSRLGNVLVKLGFVPESTIVSALCEQYGLPSVDLESFEIDERVLRLVPIETAIRHQILPLKKVGTALSVATADPTNVMALDEIKFMTGYRIEPVVALESALRAAIERYFGNQQTIELQRVYDELTEGQEYHLDLGADKEVDLAELERSSSEAPIIKLVNIIMAEAIRRGVSDIHVEPFEHEFRIRYRIDGVLYILMTPPPSLRDAVISRLKIMANLDIAERRLPQDGRIKIRIRQGAQRKDIDFRVSTLPTLFGEKVVLRILDPDKLPRDLNRLGFESLPLERFERSIARPYGMVLVTGPTGSGKTSTLYTSLFRLNTEGVNILTAEDPVEFNHPGINQVHINEQIGRSFAGVLRAFLRQDPNIIMVGEIRDLETAEIAVKAALTGHLVLSTLHTNDAPSSITRLLNMGVEPFLVASSVNLICAQRLIRLICSNCREPVQTPKGVLVSLGFSPKEAEGIETFVGAGCQRCNGTGYKGRSGLFEVLEVTPNIQDLILSGGATPQIRERAREEGMIPLRECGLNKIRAGLTTVDEVLRETAVV